MFSVCIVLTSKTGRPLNYIICFDAEQSMDSNPLTKALISWRHELTWYICNCKLSIWNKRKVLLKQQFPSQFFLMRLLYSYRFAHSKLISLSCVSYVYFSMMIQFGPVKEEGLHIFRLIEVTERWERSRSGCPSSSVLSIV